MSTTNYHTGRRIQRGRGIGSLFGSLFRTLLPLGKKLLTSDASKSIARSVGKTLKEAAVDTAMDVLQGKDVKEAAQQSLNKTKRKIASTIRSNTRMITTKKKKSVKPNRKITRRNDRYYLLK